MPQTRAEIEAEIATLRAELKVKSVTVDGTTTQFDLTERMRRLERLERERDRMRRPASARINLGGF